MALTILQSGSPLKAAARSLEEHMKNSSGKILLLLSGGSAARVLDYLTIPDPAYTTIGLVDERYSIDPKDHNIQAIHEHESIQKAQDGGAHMISILNKNFEMQECAEAYNKKLQEWKARNPHGKIIALMGIGEDGHTAGILPHPEHALLFSSLFEQASWVAGYDAGQKSRHTLRITVTNTFLRDCVDVAVVYVVGQNKKESLAHLMVPFGTLTYTPARIFLEMQHVYVYTDLVL